MTQEGARPEGEQTAPKSIAHFRILGRLGEGGMGVVYRAEDETLRRTVALKLLSATGGDAEARQRFLREARLAASISHPNVAVVYQVGEDEGRPYIAMELVEGESLRSRMTRGQLDVAMARELATQMACGLAAAHEKGIVHRDLKPENVMITTAGVVKLLDFGLAKQGVERVPSGPTNVGLARTETLVTSETGRVMGTVEYMSPEQAVGEPLDVRSDIFSFGVVFYEMLSGMRPFQGTTTAAVIMAIVREAPPGLHERVPEVGAATAALVMRCLAKEPAGRFASGREVVAALTGEPSCALTGSLSEVTSVARSSAVRRPRSRKVAGLVVSVVLVATAGGWRAARRIEGSAPAVAASASMFPATSPPAVAATYKERRLTSLPAESNIQDAALTPDGKQFVFVDSDGVWAQPVAGGARRPLNIPTLRPRGSFDLAVLADGVHVSASAAEDNGVRTWLVPLDGGPATLAYEGVGTHAALSPDGTHVAVIPADMTMVHVHLLVADPRPHSHRASSPG